MTNTEPQGIKDIREAKADYLESLVKLKTAEAAKEQAKADYIQAKVAFEQIQNQIEQCKADSAAARLKVILKQQEQALAEAEASLKAALDSIAVVSKNLSEPEKDAIEEYRDAYKAYVDAEEAVRAEQQHLWEVTYQWTGEEGKDPIHSLEETKAFYEKQIAQAEAQIAKHQAKYEEYSEVAENERAKYDVWKAEYDAYADSVKNMQYATEKIRKERAYYQVEVNDAFKAFLTAVTSAEEKVNDAVDAAKDDFEMDYTGEDGFVLPSSVIPVVRTFKSKVNRIDHSRLNYIKVHRSTDVMDVKYTDPEKASKAIFGDVENPDKASLASIIDALKRDSVVTDELIKDTAGLAAAVAKVNKEYADTKAALEKGVAAYEPIAVAKANKVLADTALAKATRDYNDAVDAFKADTAAVFAAINNFVKVWNDAADGQNLDKNDSTDVWDAFIDVMKARKKAFPYDENGKYNFFTYYKPTLQDRKVVYVKDSVDFAKMDFSGIRKDDDDVCPYGTDSRGKDVSYTFQKIISSAFEQSIADRGTYFAGKMDYRISDWEYKIQLKKISVEDLYKQENTQYWVKLFFGKYYIDPNGNGLCVEETTGGRKIDLNNDIPAVKAAYTAKQTAEGNVTKAVKAVTDSTEQYYTNVYSKFWGKNPAVKSVTSADSLKINYSEKTYTEPYILPIFEAKPGKDVKIFKNGEFVWDNIVYNANDSELLLIKEELDGQNNLKQDEYTLYAKTLAAAQIADLAKNWKENSAALAELEQVVEDVEDAYYAALEKGSDAQALADSLVTEFLGEDIIAAAELGDDVHPYEAWNTDLASYRVSQLEDLTQEGFQAAEFCKGGKFKLGGTQLKLAEANIPDYAKKIGEWKEAEKDIEDATDNLEEFKEILSTYVQEIADLDGYKKIHENDDVDEVAAKVDKAWKKFLGRIENAITKFEGVKRSAEQSLAKLEAGYDPQQVMIAWVNEALEKALAELEAAETRLDVAEKAYNQVIKNHE